MNIKKSNTISAIGSFLGTVFIAILLITCFSITVKADTIPPTKLQDLAPWKLILPINSSGVEQMGTTAISEDSTKLLKGYFSKYFYGTPDSGIAFWCPIDGATTTPTAGSNHPRTELLENYLWTMDQGGILTASMVVNRYPKDSNNIIIGQIHGGGTSSAAPFVMLHITSGSIIAYVKGDLTDDVGTQKSTLLTNVALGARIDYSLSTDGTNIFVKASCPGATGTGYWKVGIPTPWVGVTVHFSSGDYVQATGTDSTDGGMVTLYKLNISHGTSLPVGIENLTATATADKTVLLGWEAATNSGDGIFTIEKSKDGQVFSSIGSTDANNGLAGVAQYSFIDKSPFVGINYYRLAQSDAIGQVQYSKVVAVNLIPEKNISFLQNFFNNTATVTYPGASSVAYLYGALGNLCGRYPIANGQNIIYPSKINIATGIYYLQIDGKTFKLMKP